MLQIKKKYRGRDKRRCPIFRITAEQGAELGACIEDQEAGPRQEADTAEAVVGEGAAEVEVRESKISV